MTSDARFAHLVSLACHDLRTPLATVHGFARTLRRVELQEPAPRYVEMIEAATAQLTELVEQLSLVARIESGRWDPRLETTNSLELAHEAADRLHAEAVAVRGDGAPVSVEREATTRALSQLARAARRHGGLDSVTVTVAGRELEIAPIAGTAGVVVTGEELRELGAAAAVEIIRALGGSVELEGERLLVVLPAAT